MPTLSSGCVSLTSVLAFCIFGFVANGRAQFPVKVEHDLNIPNAHTPWAVDSYQSRPQLVPIHHSSVIIDRHRGSNFAGSVAGSFLYRPKISTELEGTHARTQLHTKMPIFYVLYEFDSDPGSTSDADNYTFVIVRAGATKNRRVVDKLSYNSLTSSARRLNEVVEATTTKTPDGWVRIEPKTAMEEGEYCILPIPKTNGTYSTEVYDFGINASAPNEKDAIPTTEP